MKFSAPVRPYFVGFATRINGKKSRGGIRRGTAPAFEA